MRTGSRTAAVAASIALVALACGSKKPAVGPSSPCDDYFDSLFVGPCMTGPTLPDDEVARLRGRFEQICQEGEGLPGTGLTDAALEACAQAVAGAGCGVAPAALPACEILFVDAAGRDGLQRVVPVRERCLLRRRIHGGRGSRVRRLRPEPDGGRARPSVHLALRPGRDVRQRAVAADVRHRHARGRGRALRRRREAVRGGPVLRAEDGDVHGLAGAGPTLHLDGPLRRHSRVHRHHVRATLRRRSGVQRRPGLRYGPGVQLRRPDVRRGRVGHRRSAVRRPHPLPRRGVRHEHDDVPHGPRRRPDLFPDRRLHDVRHVLPVRRGSVRPPGRRRLHVSQRPPMGAGSPGSGGAPGSADLSSPFSSTSDANCSRVGRALSHSVWCCALLVATTTRHSLHRGRQRVAPRDERVVGLEAQDGRDHVLLRRDLERPLERVVRRLARRAAGRRRVHDEDGPHRVIHPRGVARGGSGGRRRRGRRLGVPPHGADERHGAPPNEDQRRDKGELAVHQGILNARAGQAEVVGRPARGMISRIDYRASSGVFQSPEHPPNVWQSHAKCAGLEPQNSAAQEPAP